MRGTFVLCLIFRLCLSFNNLPDINDLFSSFTENVYLETKEIPTGVFFKNISIDLEQLDMAKFKTNIKYFSQRLIGNMTEFDDTAVETNNTRRLAHGGYLWQWRRASRLLVMNKLLELMLQTIYMTRHKIKQVESEKYFNSKDTSYRIGFLHRRLRRIWKRMRDIYTTMIRNRAKPYSVFTKANPYIILHHKAAKLHVDFLYLWWVLVKLHEKYDMRHGYPNTIPPD